ncbi:hypothetical protein FG167_09760 [Lacinutrix sp. WUR7]|uniref:hypothetical protein n=1 Tax=Lacinutrix sp. WUR7 TaxID=2653681 RepID=UPI00193EA919|nr:hypothetical protein [Lacinutrix sp. WUR7]QRM89503.1 hypothetical protein FG167_09760 [Lacinutrix sp. WUR7]
MKKIFIISALILAFIVSCEKDDYEAPYGDFSSLLWTTTQGFEESDYVSALNDYVGFRDVSKNALTHSWHIPSGTNLLNGDFDAEQDTIYTDFISSAGPLASSQNHINVIFRQPGVKEIELRNTFRDSVAESVFSDGVWKVNKVFTVTVFDDIKPMFKVMKGTDEILSISEADMPSEANAASWPSITLEAGEQLTYIDLTITGDPDARTWNFNGGSMDTSGGESVNLSYNGLGNYTAGSMTSKRTDNAKPDGEATKLIPLKIEVIPSTQPFVLNTDITESSIEVLSFKVTGEIATLSSEEGNFVVNVINTETGFNQNIPVQSATVNNDDATQIDLVLSEPIFNSDEITVTYTAGNIVSVDSRVLESFGPEMVEMLVEGVLNPETLGYEVPWNTEGNQFTKANTEGYLAVHNADNAAGPVYYFRDESMAFDGNSSMKFETPDTGIPNNARLRAFSFVDLNGVALGDGITEVTYMPTVWVFMEVGNTMTNIQYNLQGGPVLNFDLSTTPRGEWVRVELPLETTTGIDSGRIDLNIRNASQNDAQVQKMWIDKFDFLIIEPRL